MDDRTYIAVGFYARVSRWAEVEGIPPLLVRHAAGRHTLQGHTLQGQGRSGLTIVLMDDWWDAYDSETAVAIAEELRMAKWLGAEVRCA